MERDDLGPPVVPGVQEIGSGSRNLHHLNERQGDWDGQLNVCVPWCPPCVSQGQTESGGMVLAAICWAASAYRRCYPTVRCTYRLSVTY